MAQVICRYRNKQACFIFSSTVMIFFFLINWRRPVSEENHRLNLNQLKQNEDERESTPRGPEDRTPRLKVFDFNQNSSDPSKCYPLKVNPPAVICVYEDAKDIWVSKSLRLHGTFEGQIVDVFKQALLHNSMLDVIDIGANLGLYSLTAAAMGRKTISVEPLTKTVNHFHKSVKLNKFENRITLITNAISNKREKVFFKLNSFNQGGTKMLPNETKCSHDGCPFSWSILMDDVVPLVTERNIFKAIMKIDIEGAEHLAFANASQLFTAVHVPLIFMETKFQREFCGAKTAKTKDEKLSQNMFSFLKQNGFTRVFKAQLKKEPLDPSSCSRKWPKDVIWVHKSQRFPP